MDLSKFDLCDSCRNLKYSTEFNKTFGEHVEEVANIDMKTPNFTPEIFQMHCYSISSKLKSNGGCTKCIQHFEKKAENPGSRRGGLFSTIISIIGVIVIILILRSCLGC